jgi:8-oxo-dGTP diphosphatase
MIEVKFYSPSLVPEGRLVYSVITARFRHNWIFVRHRNRKTWEIAGGHIEPNESPADAARRELEEETGAIEFTLTCLATYSVTENGETGFGRLYFANVTKLGSIPEKSEIGKITLMKQLPVELTHPIVQKHLFHEACEYMKLNGLF